MVYVESEAPKRVKDHEWNRYNPGWVDVSEPNHGFTPHPDHATYGVTYLWVFKFPARLIIGIEASNIDGLRGFLELYKIKNLSNETLEGMLNMGHPTISAEFKKVKKEMPGPGEKIPTKYAQAYYGGELVFHHGVWSVNNHSGRHSGGKTTSETPPRVLDKEDWRKILGRIAAYCHQYMGIRVNTGDIK